MRSFKNTFEYIKTKDFKLNQTIIIIINNNNISNLLNILSSLGKRDPFTFIHNFQSLR